MTNERTQPDLDFFIDQTTRQLEKMGFKYSLWYEYGQGHVFGEMGEPDLARPSYNIYVYYGEVLILQVSYEMDLRFSLEVREAEMYRIETLLADKATGCLGANGAISLLNFTQKNDVVPHSVVRESDDKKWLGLN